MEILLGVWFAGAFTRLFQLILRQHFLEKSGVEPRTVQYNEGMDKAARFFVRSFGWPISLLKWIVKRILGH